MFQWKRAWFLPAVLGMGFLAYGCSSDGEQPQDGDTPRQNPQEVRPTSQDQARYNALMQEANAFINDYRLTDASEKLDQAAALRRGDPQVQDLMLTVNYRRDEVQGQPAYEWFNQGIDMQEPSLRIELLSRALERDANLTEYLEDGTSRDRAADAYRLRAAAYIERGQPDQAAVDAGKAIALDPMNAHAYYNRGLAFLAQEEFGDAASDFRTSIDLDPQFASAYEALGLSLFKGGDYTGAADAFRQAIDHSGGEPSPALFHNNGLALLMAGHDDEALTAFDQALDWDPGNAVARYNRGLIHFRANRMAEAINDLTSALDLRHEWPEAYLALALAYRGLENNEREKAALQEFVTQAGEGDAVDWARREIERIDRGLGINEVQ